MERDNHSGADLENKVKEQGRNPRQVLGSEHRPYADPSATEAEIQSVAKAMALESFSPVFYFLGGKKFSIDRDGKVLQVKDRFRARHELSTEAEKQVADELKSVMDSPQHKELLKLSTDPDLINAIKRYSRKFAKNPKGLESQDGEKTSSRKYLKEIFAFLVKRSRDQKTDNLDAIKVEVKEDIGKQYSKTYLSQLGLENTKLAAEVEYHPFGVVFLITPEIRVVISFKKTAKGNDLKPFFAIDNGFGDVSYNYATSSGWESKKELIAEINRLISQK